MKKGGEDASGQEKYEEDEAEWRAVVDGEDNLTKGNTGGGR